MLSIGIGVLVMLIGVALLSRIHVDVEADKAFHFSSVEKVFAVLMIFTACAMAFAHGSNDVANAVGPLAAIVGVIQSGGELAAGEKSVVPGWILLLGALGIVVGLATYGYKVIATIGKEITELTPAVASPLSWLPPPPWSAPPVWVCRFPPPTRWSALFSALVWRAVSVR